MNEWRSLGLWGSSMVIVTFWIAGAQVPQGESTAREKHSSVTVPFFAIDGHSSPIGTITQGELSVLDNKKSRSIVAIKAAMELPLRQGVLIDASSSEARSELHEPAVRAASDFLNQVLKGADDKVFLVRFSTTVDGTAFMSRDELLRSKFDLTPGGGTVLFDAVYFACNERMQPDPIQPARRVLVIISDGGENKSRVTREKVIAAAQKSGTVLLAVGTNEKPGDNLDTRRLEEFAGKPGGVRIPESQRKNMPRVFSSIKEQIESMYAGSFIPAESAKPVSFAQLN